MSGSESESDEGGPVTDRDTVPIADPVMREEEIEAVRTVMTDGRLADGPVVREFEAEFADYCGAERAVATANGTTALHAALHAVGVRPGDGVVTTPFSFVATANAVRFCGAEPVFADVDPTTYNLDPGAVERLLHTRDDVAAILPVHLYGLPAEMDALRELADDHDVSIVEDACQAHGAEYRGDRVGTLGDAACFSFYPTKNMTTGEGGIVTTDREAVADRIGSFVNHGRVAAGEDAGYQHARLGHNFRMTSMAAAIGRVQLEKLPAYTRARRANAGRLTEVVEDVSGLVPPVEPAHTRHVFHQYTVRCAGSDRHAVRDHLANHGVDTAVYYPTPIHHQPVYDGVEADVPAAERAAEEVLSLPVHPTLSTAELDRIADALRGCDDV